MGLAEKLASRATARGATAQVACGELGTVTVEALPVRELELLLRGPDGQRAVFYAACRELQAAGEELRKAGKVFTPDGILQFVSDGEAAAAARAVLELSGGTTQEQVGTKSKSFGTNQEFRLVSVQSEQSLNVPDSTMPAGENRLVSVQNTEPVTPLMEQNRLAPVQENDETASHFGQVSRETGAASANLGTVFESDKKAQAMGILPSERTQNVVDREILPSHGNGSAGLPGNGLHETKSDFEESLHETTSESSADLHEMKSDFGNGLHETKSESAGSLHETESEFGEKRTSALHETESESAEMLHEIKSELAEHAARQLLAGLQRAKWVRGG